MKDVWFLAHPVAPDEHYTFSENMAHIEKLVQLCLRTNIMVIAPYHLTCMVLDDANAHDRAMGMRVNETVITRLGHLLLSGHKRSQGMRSELVIANALDRQG